MPSHIPRAGVPLESCRFTNVPVPSPTRQNGGRGFVGPSQPHCGTGCGRDAGEENPALGALGDGALILGRGGGIMSVCLQTRALAASGCREA